MIRSTIKIIVRSKNHKYCVRTYHVQNENSENSVVDNLIN